MFSITEGETAEAGSDDDLVDVMSRTDGTLSQEGQWLEASG